MPVTVKVKTNDPVVRAQREAAAQRVLTYFGEALPGSRRILCFLDDDDAVQLRRDYGAANRGGYMPIHDDTPLLNLPDYVTDCIHVDDGHSLLYPRVVDDLVYLYGSTCANEVGLTMTLAHELEHAIQHANTLKLWAVNSLVNGLDGAVINALGLKWADIPTEVEARIVAKRAAVKFFGEQAVLEYIDGKVAERITDADAEDWQFVRTLTASSSVHLEDDTQRLFPRLKGYRSELERALRERKDNPDFDDIDLAALLGGK